MQTTQVIKRFLQISQPKPNLFNVNWKSSVRTMDAIERTFLEQWQVEADYKIELMEYVLWPRLHNKAIDDDDQIDFVMRKIKNSLRNFSLKKKISIKLLTSYHIHTTSLHISTSSQHIPTTSHHIFTTSQHIPTTCSLNVTYSQMTE